MASGKQKNKKAFLQAYGYGPARLAAATARIDWTRPDALGRARDALSLYIATVAELLKDAARDKRRQPGTFLNTLVADVDPAELPLLWLAVHHLERDGALPGLLPATRAALDAAGTALASHWRLLRDGTLPAPRLTDIADVDSATLIALHGRQVAAAADAGTPAATLRLLRFAGQLHESRGESRAALLRHVRAIRKALGDAAAPVDYTAFRSLPAPLRRTLLFTPSLATFLDAQAQAAARPPSPDFDPLYLERALDNLAAGTLDHLDVDTLFIGAAGNPAFRARIVGALANGSGRLECDDDVRERLIAGADLAELCLVACAAARAAYDMQRALACLPALPPRHQVLGAALHGFARIAWREWPPAAVPATIAGDAAFRDDMLDDAARRLAAHVLATEGRGDDVHQAPVMLLRQFTEWLHLAGPRAARDTLATLDRAFAEAGGVLAAEVAGSDLHALCRAGPRGERLAATLAAALRAHDPARWEHPLFRQLADSDPAFARQVAGAAPRAHERETLRHALPAGTEPPA